MSAAGEDWGGRITRRGALAGVAAFGIGASLDRVLIGDSGGRKESQDSAIQGGSVPFYGTHQSGIATLAPEFLSFAAFDLDSRSVDDLRVLLQEWTTASSSLTQGKLYLPDGAGSPALPPPDTGEAKDLGPVALTVTVGFGPGLFDRGGSALARLRRRRPRALSELPPFEGDSIDPDRSGGDLCVQACAEDPQVAFHAVHVLTRIAVGTASLRWTQEGFGRTSSTSRSQPTPRNLMGFKDGTNNIRGEDADAMEEHVWVQAGDEPAWMNGGSYLVARRIKILLDVWDATSLEGQERTIGRQKESGAPLGGRREFDPLDLDAREGGELAIPVDAHVRLSSPERNDGLRILRRGYSFSEPSEPGSGQIDAGLFFICFQRDPQRQFVPIQRRLAASDALNRHILHTGSAVFACPPGARPGGFVGEGLFA